MPWRPLLQGAEATRARAAIAHLTSKGSRRRKPVLGPGLALGHAGLSLLHAYRARASGDPTLMGRARRSLGRALAALEREQLTGSLATGLPGIAWTLAHLDREGFLEADPELATALDGVLLDAVGGKVWRGDYELHQGLVGLGTVALERLPRPTAWRTLERVVHHLEAGAERIGGGLAWGHEDPEEGGRRTYLLGLTHGVAGMIAFLARMCELGVAARKARRTLDRAMAFLLEQELPAAAASRFPLKLFPGRPGAPARSAWCHGDIGIATQLLSAARSVREPAWEREALRVARDVASRPFEDAGIVDPTLCHGALGTAHLLNRMYQATADPALRRGARRYLARGLQLWRAAEAGTARYPEHGHRGLLIGDAGMALVLLAATTSVEPRWDRWMSVALSPAARRRTR